MSEKLFFEGEIISVQPRIRLLRSFDERSHSYLGYLLGISGVIGGEKGDFRVGIGKALQAKYNLAVGFRVSGECLPPSDPRMEPADYYKVSKFKVTGKREKGNQEPPPWHGVPPELPVYRERGHRRLDTRRYNGPCSTCIWRCRMSVEMIIDQWRPEQKKYRVETFCYGPKSCPLYRAGPVRKVPGRKGMVWEEEDWVDGDATAHRGPDE